MHDFLLHLLQNRIGFLGCYAIEEALKERVGEENSEKVDNMVTTPPMMVDVDGNMIFQEVGFFLLWHIEMHLTISVGALR